MFGSRSRLRAAAHVALLLNAGLGLCGRHWVDIWASMPQLTEPANLPPAPFNQTGVVFRDATVRQTVRVTLEADTIRLQISNAFGGSDLPITAVTVGLPVNGSAGVSAVKPGSLKPVTFSGGASFVVPQGAVVFSDPLDYKVEALTMLTVSIYLAQGQTTNSITSHPGSRTTSWFAPGDQVSATNLTGDGVLRAEHWYFLSAVEGWVPRSHRALALVGDSITDGRGSTNNKNDRWPDVLADRLHGDGARSRDEARIAVINQAAGGNRILADGLGPNALSRIDRDVVAHSGVVYALVFEGVNDIGTGAVDAATQKTIGDRLISAYDQMVTRLHNKNIAVFGATITPMSGPGQGYSHPERERTRLRVNEWILTSGRFDAVVDFDAVVRDPANHTQLAPAYNTANDYLHPNQAGYKAMAEAVDLSIFTKFKNGVDYPMT